MFDPTEEDVNFFDADVDLDEIPDDPFDLPANTYKVEVVEASVAPTKNDETKKGLTLKFQIIEGKYSTFFPFQTWLWMPGSHDDKEDPRVTRAYATLKKYFLALGIGRDELRYVTPGKLIGLKAFVRTYMDEDVKTKRKHVKVAHIMPISSEDGDEGTTDPFI